MDLLVFSTRLIARPVIAWLQVQGATPERRRQQLIAEMTAYGTKDDLVDRQLIRSAVWAMLFAFAVAPMVAAGVALEVVLGGDGGVAGQIPRGVLLFLFWMSAMTGLKIVAASLLPERRWNPRSPLARALLVAQTPDAVVSLTITVISLVLMD